MIDLKDIRDQTDSNPVWLHDHWKIYVAISYIAICLFDFIIAPTGIFLMSTGLHIAYIPWVPLTLQGGGLFHMSMLTILGVASYTSGMANIERVKNMPDFSNASSETNTMSSTTTTTK